VDTKTAMGETLRASAFALTEAKYAAGDFRYTVFDNVGTASVKVSLRACQRTGADWHATQPVACIMRSWHCIWRGQPIAFTMFRLCSHSSSTQSATGAEVQSSGLSSMTLL